MKITGRSLGGEVPSVPHDWRPESNAEKVTLTELWIRKGGSITKLQRIGEADYEVVGQWPEAEAPVVFAPTVDRFERESTKAAS